MGRLFGLGRNNNCEFTCHEMKDHPLDVGAGGPSKFRNKRTTVGGITFASRKEASRYHELKLMQAAGVISGLSLQPRFPISLAGAKICTYVGDFRYAERGRNICEDAKGFQTPLFKLKWKLVKAAYPEIDFRLV